jgi:hypothetical protein
MCFQSIGCERKKSPYKFLVERFPIFQFFLLLKFTYYRLATSDGNALFGTKVPRLPISTQNHPPEKILEHLVD